MRRFHAPPGWPPPPNARWRPPKGWSPPPTWPEPPAAWAFWIDEHGRRVPGPLGRFGGPSRGWLVAAVAAVALLLAGVGVLSGDGGSGDVASDPPTAGDDGVGRPATTAVPPSSPSPTSAGTVRTPAPFPTSRPLPTSPTAVPTATPDPTRVPTPVPSSSRPPSATPSPSSAPVFYKNCSAVRAAGKAPLLRGQPGYSERLDRNGDGIACDHGNS